ncbi:hypothetical protein [Dactylosporangium sp. NPDC051484]|uniref:hypothetical protein n=1 Tax=Dactylosporangium sp. NPDC051484 TaxID=3154942 RepID=UPI00344C4339
MRTVDYGPLASYLDYWVRRQPFGWHHRGAQSIANEWINDLAFADIRLARWLATPEGGAITTVVRAVLLPYPTNHAASVLIEAINIAARQRTNKQIVLTGAGGLAAAIVVYMALSN